MTEQRYAIPVDELVAGVRVPVEEQVAVHTEPQPPPPDWSDGLTPFGDGMSGDADCD